MNAYIERVLAETKKKNANEPEFLQTVEEVLKSVEPLIDAHPEYYDRIREFVLKEEGVAYAESVLEEYIAKAREALRPFPAGEATDLLAALADFIGERQS